MVEIGCIEMFGRVMTGATYHCYYNPERAMPSAAEQVHGLSDRFLSDKPLFPKKAAELLEFLGDSPLVAHNANFDMGFLNRELARASLPAIDRGRMIDTVALARLKHPGAKLSLDALCSRYGIDRSHRIKHGALLDAELLAHVYIELTGGRQIGLGLSDGDDVSGSNNPLNSIVQSSRPYRKPRIFAASDAEIARHSEFIDQIKDAIWKDRPPI